MTTLESKTGWAKESPLLAGEMIRGRYVVEGELGHGGMGTVYLCLDEVSRVRVAVKALPPELSGDSEGLGKVLGAFPGAYGLRHPNIAGLRTLEKDDEGRYFLVIDVVEGENLRAWARRKREEAPEDGVAAWKAAALDALRQVAAALDYAHGAGVTHGDLKPGNVMVNEQGKAKVLDFSLAGQVRTSLGRLGPREWPYLAPEQWRGRRADAKSDQYALGVLAYELLAGHPPFENGELAVMKTAALREKAASIPGAGRAAMKVLRRALAKSPEKRWGSCGEFVEALAGSKAAPGGKRGKKAAGWAVAAALLAAGAFWAAGAWRGGGARAWLEAVLPQADAGLAAEQKRAAERWAAEQREEEERWEAERQAEERRMEEELAAAERAAAEREEKKRAEREAAIRRKQEALEATVYRLAPLARNKVESAAGMGHDRGQGFGERLDDMRAKLAQGEAAAKGRNFGKAKACFEESMGAARWLEENAPLREEAKRAREAAEAAKALADAGSAESLGLWSCRRGNERAAAAEQAFGEARFRKAAALWGEAAAAYARSEREKAAAAARAEAARAREARREARREEERRREADRHAAERKAEEERMAAEEAAAAEAARLESARLESDRLDAERADAEGEAEESRREEGEAEWTAEAEAEWMMEEGEWMAGEETEWPAGGEEEEAADDTVPLWPEEGEDLSAEPAFAAVLPDDTDVPPVVPAARPAGETKTVTLPGGATMEMAWCPPGTFTMGSPGGEEGKDEDETPHAVTLTKGFWLAKTEVTQRQWRSVTGSNPSFHPGDDFPVENVSWNDCREFCRKAGMRLPTEAEWEYACRAGSAGAYAGTGKLEEMGWSAPGSGSMTHPAGEKRANAWGLHDMHGNAWEWCADGYQADLGTDAATDPAGPAAGETRVMRGGSFINGAGSCRAASRSPASPDSRNRFCGFRPVVEEDFP